MIELKVRGWQFLVVHLMVGAASLAWAGPTENQAWVNMIKAMETNPAAESTFNQAISFINYYPRSERAQSAQYMVGEILFLQGKYDQAAAYYKVLLPHLDKIGFGDSVLYRLGECSINAGQISQAQEYWGTLLKRYPDTHLRSEVEANNCQLLLKQGKYKEANDAFRNLLNRYPHYRDRHNIVTAQAQIELAFQKYDQVLKRLARLETPDTYYLKGRALFSMGRFQEAANYFDKLIKQNSRHPYAINAMFYKAESFFRAQNIPAADEAYRAFLKTYPRALLSPYARYKYAAVLLQEKQYREGLANLNALLGGDKQSISPLMVKYLMAEMYIGLNQFQAASELFREIVSNAPEEQILETCLLKYSWVLYKSRNYATAIQTANRYIENFSGSPRAISAYFVIANSQLFLGRFQEAIKIYRNMVTQFEYSNLVEIALLQVQINYARLKQFDQVISQTEKIIRVMEINVPPVERNNRAMALYMLGEAYYREKHPREAIALFQQLITKYWDTTAYTYAKESLVWGLFEQEEYTQAMQEAERIIKDRQVAPSIRDQMVLVKGHCLFNMKNYKGALEAYNNWLTKHPREPSRIYIQYLMGLGFYRMKFYKNALEVWEKVIAQPSRDEFARNALAQVADALFRGGDFERARDRYLLFLKRYPEDAQAAFAYMRIAQTYFNLGQDAQAIRMYQLFIKKYPQDKGVAAAQDGIETTSFRQLKKNQTLPNLQRFLQYFPKGKFADQVQYQIAETYYKSKDYPNAIQQFNILILNYPGSEAIANSMFFLGNSYDQLQKSADAISAYTLFIQTFPKHDLMPEILTRLGADHYLLGNYEEAIGAYRQIVDRFPVKPYIEDALYNIAVCYEKMKKLSEAMAMYQDFAVRYPNNPRTSAALIQIGIYYQNQQLWDLAIETYRKASRLEKGSALLELNFRIGDCYENAGKLPDAVKAYQALVSLSPKSNIYRVTALSQLAALYEKQELWDRAIALYRDIAENAQKPEWREEAVKRVKLLSQ